jgi:acetyl-CoA synthetase
MNVLLPTLYFGRPLVGARGRWSAERAFALLERYQITNVFLAPVVLKMMMESMPAPRSYHQLALRSLTCSGPNMDKAVFEWCQSALGVTPNELFGQAEVNALLGHSQGRWPTRFGSLGRPYPGHRVAVIDENDNPTAIGQIGELALNRYDIHGYPDPVLFLGYWRNDLATQARFSGDWCRTGEQARVDAEGYLWPVRRTHSAFTLAD